MGPEARGGKSQLSALTRKRQICLERRLQGSSGEGEEPGSMGPGE